jgi:hypothetical protein
MKVQSIRKLSLSRTDKVLERAAIILLVLSTASSLFAFCNLPQQIPIHFTGNKTDSFGDRAFIFMPVALSAFFYLLLSAISRYSLARKEGESGSLDKDLFYYRATVWVMRALKLALIIAFTIDLGESVRILIAGQKYLSSIVFISEGIFIGIPAILVTTILVRRLPKLSQKIRISSAREETINR